MHKRRTESRGSQRTCASMMEGDKGRTAFGFSVMGGTQPTRLSTGTAPSVTHTRARSLAGPGATPRTFELALRLRHRECALLDWAACGSGRETCPRPPRPHLSAEAPTAAAMAVRPALLMPARASERRRAMRVRERATVGGAHQACRPCAGPRAPAQRPPHRPPPVRAWARRAAGARAAAQRAWNLSTSSSISASVDVALVPPRAARARSKWSTRPCMVRTRAAGRAARERPSAPSLPRPRALVPPRRFFAFFRGGKLPTKYLRAGGRAR
jgi:hypothetical protein